MDMAGLELGNRLLRHGGLIFHEPGLLPSSRPTTKGLSYPLSDRYLYIIRSAGVKQAQYVCLRRALRDPFGAEIAEYVAALRRNRQHPSVARKSYRTRLPPVDRAKTQRCQVSVILPTLGRYGFLRQLLEQLSRQTIRPLEVLCVDQNPLAERRPGLYEEFREKLNLRVMWQSERGQWTARNAAIRESKADYLLFLDDDSEIDRNFIESHLQCLFAFDAAISAGASLSEVGAPVPLNYSFYRVADQFDSGNAMVRRDAFRKVGLFDTQYDLQRRGDGEFGIRAYLHGLLSIHSPTARRIHLKSARGGLRVYGSWDAFRTKGLLAPKPSPSVLYMCMTYFSRRAMREEIILGFLDSWTPYRLKGRIGGIQRALYACWGVLGLPRDVIRLLRSIRQAKKMFSQGAGIQELPRPEGSV
ncbi:MAG: glycosyltransferase [Candidatus Eiseniibacteriota bacterium]|nr:MAG: glycosyltransferase [Candidatus Eisenbacteria bacterium]